MNQYVFGALVAIVVCCVAIVTRCLVPYLKSQVEASKYADLVDIVQTAVEALEQTIRESGQGKAKKAQVIAFVSAWLAEHDMYITEEQLDKLIEAAVFTMNKEQ